MSTLVEIEAAADSLPSEQKQELFLFLAARPRSAGQLPPHELTRQQFCPVVGQIRASLTRRSPRWLIAMPPITAHGVNDRR